MLKARSGCLHFQECGVCWPAARYEPSKKTEGQRLRAWRCVSSSIQASAAGSSAPSCGAGEEDRPAVRAVASQRVEDSACRLSRRRASRRRRAGAYPGSVQRRLLAASLWQSPSRWTSSMPGGAPVGRGRKAPAMSWSMRTTWPFSVTRSGPRCARCATRRRAFGTGPERRHGRHARPEPSARARGRRCRAARRAAKRRGSTVPSCRAGGARPRPPSAWCKGASRRSNRQKPPGARSLAHTRRSLP